MAFEYLGYKVLCVVNASNGVTCLKHGESVNVSYSQDYIFRLQELPVGVHPSVAVDFLLDNITTLIGIVLFVFVVGFIYSQLRGVR